jgi:hypothetical protein
VHKMLVLERTVLVERLRAGEEVSAVRSGRRSAHEEEAGEEASWRPTARRTARSPGRASVAALRQRSTAQTHEGARNRPRLVAGLLGPFSTLEG